MQNPLDRPGGQNMIKKRPAELNIKGKPGGPGARTPTSLAKKNSTISTPGEKKEKRERVKREPKKPETVDVAWRLYAVPAKA